MAWAAVQRFAQPQPIDAPVLGVALSMVSSVINGGVAWMLMRASREHHSIALEADARHLYTDVWTSIGVAVGVFLVQATGWLWLDPLLALGVAANITREAWSLLRRSVDGLMDRGLEPAELAAIDATLQRLAAEAQGAVRLDHVRSRRAAQDKFCQLHMHVPGRWSLARAAAQRAVVERALVDAVARPARDDRAAGRRRGAECGSCCRRPTRSESQMETASRTPSASMSAPRPRLTISPRSITRYWSASSSAKS
ncbi:MAG: cation diffusion facilitator family transporter [Chthoniobacteraceae bacterium]